MYSTGNQRKQKEGSSLGYSIWPFSPLEEAKRGGTAPGFPERNFYYQKKLPVSSHKFEVNSMNSPSHPKSNKVSIRGSGWNSSISRAPVKLLTMMQENPKTSALKPTEDFKRPVTIGYRASEVTKINEMARHRPPSRHKTPPKATGLYLPPSSCTPPNELATKEMFEKTWSYKHPAEQQENSELQYSDRKNAGSPAFEHAWDEGVTRPKTQNEKTRRMRIIAAQEKVQPPMGNDIIKKPLTDKLYDVPIILNRDEKYNRRIFSAHVIEAKSGKQRPPSYKAVKAAFQSSLDGDFLNLFEPAA